jgi:hypothetical protein
VRFGNAVFLSYVSRYVVRPTTTSPPSFYVSFFERNDNRAGRQQHIAVATPDCLGFFFFLRGIKNNNNHPSGKKKWARWLMVVDCG